jgi:hypothetical protein
VSNKFRALPYVISHFTVLFLDRWGALQVCSVPHLFFAFIRYFSAFVISKYILYNQGVVLVLNVYLQATGDKVYYHSCSILDDVLGLNIFDPTDYARFVWLKESLLEQVSSYLTYEIDYSSSTTKDIEEGLKRSLLDLTDFKVREDEPCKY